MVEDFPRHVETDIDQYANPHNAGNVVNMLDVMVAGATEVDVEFNVNVNTHSDGQCLHNTGGHQDTAAGAKLCIVTMPVARRCNPGIVDHVTTITTPGECIGAIVTEEGVAINPKRKDLLAKLEGKTEATLGKNWMEVEATTTTTLEPPGDKSVDVVSDNERCATFVLTDEDHTLGNALRYVLSRNPRVEFAGYSIPHPTQNKLHVRVQTREGVSAVEAFKEALLTLQTLCGALSDEYEAAIPPLP